MFDYTYATNGILIVNIDCVYFVITYCNKKTIIFKNVTYTFNYIHPYICTSYMCEMRCMNRL